MTYNIFIKARRKSEIEVTSAFLKSSENFNLERSRWPHKSVKVLVLKMLDAEHSPFPILFPFSCSLCCLNFVTCKSNQPMLCLQVKVTVFSPWQTPLSTTLSTMRFSCATLSRPSSLTASHPIMAHLPRAPSSTPVVTLHPPGSATSDAAAAQEVRTCSASSPTTI